MSLKETLLPNGVYYLSNAAYSNEEVFEKSFISISHKRKIKRERGELLVSGNFTYHTNKLSREYPISLNIDTMYQPYFTTPFYFDDFIWSGYKGYFSLEKRLKYTEGNSTFAYDIKFTGYELFKKLRTIKQIVSLDLEVASGLFMGTNIRHMIYADNRDYFNILATYVDPYCYIRYAFNSKASIVLSYGVDPKINNDFNFIPLLKRGANYGRESYLNDYVNVDMLSNFQYSAMFLGNKIKEGEEALSKDQRIEIKAIFNF